MQCVRRKLCHTVGQIAQKMKHKIQKMATFIQRRRRRFDQPPSVNKVADAFLNRTNDIFERAQVEPVHIINIQTTIDDILQQHGIDDQYLNMRIDGVADITFRNYNLEINVPRDTQSYVNTAVAVEQMKQPTTKKADIIQRVFDASVSHTSDSQNVHDSDVQIDLKRIVNKLNINRNSNAVPQEILNYILVSDFDTTHKEKAIQAYDKICDHGIRIMAFDCTEQQILDAVWRRAHDPLNKDNQENIRRAIVDALASCVENGAVVCSTGRSSRILSSLCLLDCDDSINKVGTSEMYKNEILEKANRLMNDTIKEFKESADADHQKLGQSFDDMTITDTSDRAKSDFMKSYEDKLDKLGLEYTQHWTPKMRTELADIAKMVL